MALVVLLALVLSTLAWVDPLFLPLVLLGPVLTGVALARVGRPVRQAALTWLLAGLLMLVEDWLVNREDVVFHAAVAVVTALLAALAAAVTTRLRRSHANA